MTQGGDVLLIEVLELATDASALAVNVAYQQLHVHRQPQVVDHKLQAAFVHFANGQGLVGGVKAQASGRQVNDADFHRCAVFAEKAQLGRDFDPCVLTLGFGFVDNVGVYLSVHKVLFLVNSIEAVQTIINSTATKMLPAEKVMVRDDQVLNQR